jgi:uncharacterized protein YecE (DUF72 family)
VQGAGADGDRRTARPVKRGGGARAGAEQGDLFGAPALAGAVASGASMARSAGVAPAVIAPTMAALAEEVPRAVRLGTSSWAFPGWEGLVYARAERAERLARDGLAAYAQHPLLRTVGLDRTFYAPITREAFARYAAAVPVDFRFLVKAAAALTTPGGLARLRAADPVDRFLDAAWATEAVITPAVEGLGDRLGVLLFQFPPLPRGSRALRSLPERLGAFLAALPGGVPYAVEVRNPSLLGAAYRDALAGAGVAHGFTVHPSMPSLAEQAAAVAQSAWAGGTAVVRWMLQRDQQYDAARDAWAPFRELAAPDLGARTEVAQLVAALTAHAPRVLVIANNKAEGCAPRTLEELARLLAVGTQGPARVDAGLA